MAYSRRKFFGLAGATAAGTLAISPLQAFLANKAFGQTTTMGYGPLVPDPNNLLELPAGFKYRVISRTGDLMADGNPVPNLHDGMAAFQGPRGTTILICNHEINGTGVTGSRVQVPSDLAYDPVCKGGTTNIVVNSNRQLVKQFASLGGTIRNCAGGPTPWGSWITSEENTTTPANGEGRVQSHGFNFEIPASATGPVKAVPLVDMGRFNHEAIAVDPKTGYVYETEDRGDGLFYRFIPNVPGKLAEGGKLQAMVIVGKPFAVNTNNRDLNSGQFAVGQKYSVDWVDIPNPNPIADDVRFQGSNLGAARFSRGEGIWYGNGEIYFAATNGGLISRGQIWRYIPGDETIDLFVESKSADELKAPDNIVVAPFGDLIICEDASGTNFLRGVTPQGQLYTFARNAFNGSEFAGACFSPDNQTMFVNVQSPGITLAIWGPWNSRQ
ncbi:alkaline phosphatase PhoX [Anabaena sp. CCY 0017]|uniref:alkaline phosphatase PhoX n=1 Tax=Anabaena sp. CCY 0017 TaxID=3103866 RepID=UPI0039C73E31